LHGDEFGYRTVIGPLGLGSKKTARDLIAPAVVGHAFAALAPARTALVGAGALDQVSFEITFHELPLLSAENVQFGVERR
jgi:hypothetical protein